MNCIIIEDQAPAQRILKKYIHDIGSLQLSATFTDALQAMDFLKNNDVDLKIHIKIQNISLFK